MADTSKITLKQLKDAMNKAKNYTDNEIAGITGVSKVEPEELDMPKVFFYGNALPTSKTDVNLTMDYISNTTKFSSFVKLKCQGTSSMNYAKKNFTVAMYSDEARETKLKKDFKGWGAQSKFCLKANYVDTTHTRNLSGARIAYDMVASRPDSPFKQQLLQCPRNGAVDGFPIKLYFNGEFYGIYTWNIPKDGWMFNMDVNNPNYMVLCAEKNNDGTLTSDDVLRCEFRKEWDGTDGNSWSIEFGTYSDALKNSFNRCVNFVMTATDEEFKTNIGNYFDLYSLLDYYCFSYLAAHIDGLAKNMLMVTYDGIIWGATLYDMDSIYGADFNGASFKAANIQCPEQYQDTNSLLWQRIESCFSAELYARYLELRQGALSLSNIIKHVEEIYDVIPDRVFADEKAKWTNLPQVNTNTMTRFRNYMRDRAVYVDAQMQEIGTKVACTGITLSADTLSFTATDTQTLTATVEPSNTTDVVTWSVSPTGIVTVDGGVVTPVANGTCTITATCGSYSATCSVNVALPSIACTSISLDKTELQMGVFSGEAAGEVVTTDIETTWEAGYIKRNTTAVSDGTAGQVGESAGDSTCDFIPVQSGDVIRLEFNVSRDISVGAVAYDSSQNYLSTAALTTDMTGNGDVSVVWDATGINKDYYCKKLTIGDLPEGTAYIRICCYVTTSNINSSISKFTLTREGGSGNNQLLNYTLKATVLPTNTTDAVIWSVEPTGVCTVNNGLVTAKANGSAVITVTCGTQSATCNVTVSGFTIELVEIDLLADTTTSQGYLSLATGAFTSSSTASDLTTDFIPLIDNGNIYRYTFGGGTYGKACFYDASKQFIRGTNLGLIAETADKPAAHDTIFFSHDSILKDAAYVRFCVNRFSPGSAYAKAEPFASISELLVPEGDCPVGYQTIVINEHTAMNTPAFPNNPSGVNGNTIFEIALPASTYGDKCIPPKLCINPFIDGFNGSAYAGLYNRVSYSLYADNRYLVFSLDSSIVGTTLEEAKAWLANNPITVYISNV